jgi:hypothetical protein
LTKPYLVCLSMTMVTTSKSWDIIHLRYFQKIAVCPNSIHFQLNGQTFFCGHCGAWAGPIPVKEHPAGPQVPGRSMEKMVTHRRSM